MIASQLLCSLALDSQLWSHGYFINKVILFLHKIKIAGSIKVNIYRVGEPELNYMEHFKRLKGQSSGQVSKKEDQGEVEEIKNESGANVEHTMFSIGMQYKTMKKSNVEQYQVVKNEETGEIYEGKLDAEGQYTKKGMIFYKDFSIFKGEFKAGAKIKGVEYFNNDDVYEGHYLNDKPHLKGTLRNARLKKEYTGEFQNYKKNGVGKLKTKTNTYTGQFVQDKVQGVGEVQFQNGDFYQGQMWDGLPQGFGVLHSVEKAPSQSDATPLQRGLTHEGLFHTGKKHGLGRETSEDGSYLYGVFYYNQPVGQVLRYDPQQNCSSVLYYPSPLPSQKGSTPSVTSHRQGKPLLSDDGHHDTVLTYLLGNLRAMNEAGQLQTGFTDSAFDTKKELLPSNWLERVGQLDSGEEKRALFQQEICPEQVSLQRERVDPQVQLFLTSLAQYPRLVLEVCSLKYSLQDGYFLFKQYDQTGHPFEEILDDLLVVETSPEGKTVPFYGQPHTDLGWLLLHKLICKHFKKYGVSFKDCQVLEKLYHLFTGRPVLKLSFQNLLQDSSDSEHLSQRDKLNRRTQNRNKKVFHKIRKHEQNQLKFGYPRRDEGGQCPFLVLGDYTHVSAKDNCPYDYLLVKKAFREQRLSSDFEMHQLQPQHQLLLRQEDQMVVAMTRGQFAKAIQEVVICLAPFQSVLNIVTFQLDDNKVDKMLEHNISQFVSFKLITDCHVTLHLQQELRKQKDYLPFRLILARQTLLHRRDGAGRKQYAIKDFQYVLGRGQVANQDEYFLHKELAQGEYVLMLQMDTDAQNKVDQVFHLKIYSPFLCNLHRIPEIQNFLPKVYKSHLVLLKQQYEGSQGKPIKNFLLHCLGKNQQQLQPSDLFQDHDIYIIQYFFQKEGTYVEYLVNDSPDQLWRQNFQFECENMHIMRQNNSNFKLQLEIKPQEDDIIIIQQYRGEEFSLRGGQGFCSFQKVDPQ